MIDLQVHFLPLEDTDLSVSDRLAILRGQLTILRRQREQDLPITVESLARTERVARSLEQIEVPL